LRIRSCCRCHSSPVGDHTFPNTTPARSAGCSNTTPTPPSLDNPEQSGGAWVGDGGFAGSTSSHDRVIATIRKSLKLQSADAAQSPNVMQVTALRVMRAGIFPHVNRDQACLVCSYWMGYEIPRTGVNVRRGVSMGPPQARELMSQTKPRSLSAWFVTSSHQPALLTGRFFTKALRGSFLISPGDVRWRLKDGYIPDHYGWSIYRANRLANAFMTYRWPHAWIDLSIATATGPTIVERTCVCGPSHQDIDSNDRTAKQ